MKALLLPFLLLLGTTCFAGDFKWSDVPLKDGAPYYERVIPLDAAQNKTDVFYTAQLFFAEYFKKSTPEEKIADKEDGRLTLRVNLFYCYLVNPDMAAGRCLCLADIRIEPERCIIRVYDLDILHKVSRGYTVGAGGTSVLVFDRDRWQHMNMPDLYQQAAKGSYKATNEMKAVHTEIERMLAAFTKKMTS